MRKSLLILLILPSLCFAQFSGFVRPYLFLSDTALMLTPYALLSENVASATILETARTLWGQSFNGSADVTGDINIDDGYSYMYAGQQALRLSKGTDATVYTNVMVGAGAGSPTATEQTAVGRLAGTSNTGTQQSAFGYWAGRSNTGTRQSAFGYFAGRDNTGNQVLGIGYEATRNNTGNDVVAIGYEAGKGNTVANQFIVKQSNINAMPLIQGDFSTGNVGIGTTTPGKKLDVLGTFGAGTASIDSLDYDNPIIQVHNTDTIIPAAINTWYNTKWLLRVAEESTSHFVFTADSLGIISNVDGVLRVQGCGHWYWAGGTPGTATVYIRTLVNATEKRCLQASDTRTKDTGQASDLPFTGTVAVTAGDTIKVQYRVTNTNIRFAGAAVFDNPVAISVNLEKISNKQ